MYFYNVALKVIKHEPQFSCHDHFSPFLMIFIHLYTKASNKTHAKIFSTNAIWGTTQAEKIWGQQWKHESDQIMMSDDPTGSGYHGIPSYVQVNKKFLQNR